MTRRILQQPNGKFSVWSSIVDDFILEDLTEDELVRWYTNEKREKAFDEITDRIDSWKEGRSPYSMGSITTYEDAVEWKERIEENE